MIPSLAGLPRVLEVAEDRVIIFDMVAFVMGLLLVLEEALQLTADVHEIEVTEEGNNQMKSIS